MMEKEGSDECQSKAPTIHQLLLARWGKGREEDEEESRKKTQDIGEHKSCWKVREKQKKKPKGSSKIETQIYNSTTGERYIVEFPEEEGEEEENKEKKNTTEPWELELAQSIKARLKLKRKREGEDQMLIEYGNQEGATEEEEMSSCSKKGRTQGKEVMGAEIRKIQQSEGEDNNQMMAEEAGLTMLHPAP
ncbi:uncharacterized protein DS421_15g511290 [Arachis hypogaea]|nr:uncharacterized protein DS421_15g511290 [Arachis hypogaea]